jgi:hypothetical protein
MHDTPGSHGSPQRPQCIGSVSGSVQPLPQSSWPVGHIMGMRQLPAEHVSVARQALPQVPQLAGLV